jgi:cytosine/uracil/thiamine/allantoin permease
VRSLLAFTCCGRGVLRLAQEGQFWQVFWPAVTANVGYWATLSLNIPDFTRYAKSQRDQVLGQAIGLPLFMALFTFLGEEREAAQNRVSRQ